MGFDTSKLNLIIPSDIVGTWDVPPIQRNEIIDDMHPHKAEI